MTRLLPVLPQVGCAPCAFRSSCGGLYGQQSLYGCLGDCVACDETCDWVCPLKEDFVDRVREVGGLDGRWDGEVLPLRVADPPPYLPMIRHGSTRATPFSGNLVAVALEDAVKMIDGQYRPVREHAEAFRAHFGVRSDAGVLLVGVARDSVIERYWQYRRKFDVPSALRALNLVGVTVPNYSFFNDGPRTQVLWNRRRMEIVTQEFSAAGIPVVPHLNAVVPEDWGEWLKFMRLHPEVVHVAKEFRTGLRSPGQARAAIRDLADFQERLGRPLHPIIIGGTGYAAELGRHFARVTLIDSQPFMKAAHRRLLRRAGEWVPLQHEGPLDEVLEVNVRRHSAYCAAAVARGAASAEAERQVGASAPTVAARHRAPANGTIAPRA